MFWKITISRLITSLRWRLLKPRIPLLDRESELLVTIGSKYGRKTYENIFREDEDVILISAGAGEDISFDLEFAAHHNAKIFVIDPTTTAIAHFKALENRWGEHNATSYSETSKQNVTSYNTTTKEMKGNFNFTTNNGVNLSATSHTLIGTFDYILN